ncbi:hypothetical protein Sango_1922000 [Sesamum angolense]|uniref:Uncharacterized protein n=1 Tax=Sesamum angolense TaxID=2727404 RepID=A0AAE2BN15_9LAMI|nr:hypothetical protein Sango_1922000 [Sesamum angolense]
MIEWENSDLNFVRRIISPIKEMFDKYWEECCLVLAVPVVFDPSSKLPILAKIARDILVVPTTVASKVAFSVGGRVIDESRVCLLPDVVEALVGKALPIVRPRGKSLPQEHSSLFSADIMTEELPTHFNASLHLPAYNGTADPTEHISKHENTTLLYKYTDGIKCSKHENATLLYKYIDGIKCHMFLTTLTNYAQQWLDQLPIGSVRSFAEHNTIFLYQFTTNKKCRKSASSLFGVKQEAKETLRAYIKCFNKAILEVLATHPKVLISAITQGLCNRHPLEAKNLLLSSTPY